MRGTPDGTQPPQASASTNSATRAGVSFTDAVSQGMGAESSDESTGDKFPAREIRQAPGGLGVGNQNQPPQKEPPRSPGINEWIDGIAAEARVIEAQLTCYHPTGVRFCDYPREGFAYIIQAEGGGMVKIGRAQSPQWRLRTIQAASPVRLHVLALASGPELERIWHVQFHGLRRHAEWFDPAVADYFREHGAPDECVRCRIYGDARDRPTRGKAGRRAA